MEEWSQERDAIFEEIIEGMGELNNFELQPMLFKIRRLLHGKKKYGSNYPGRENWPQEQLEELDDFINYLVWELAEGKSG
jgi:hypothetical protein